VEPALKPGDRVGSFELIERLGSGGMGDVFRARDTRLGRTVALKFLKPGASDDLLRRLDREARAVSALNHPNIVQIYDVPEWADHPGQRYIVMEDVAGETLRRRLSRGPLSVHELLQLGAQLTDGLAKAHRAGILHRDLKPENLMLTPEGTLKILDFGLAKLAAAPLADIEEGNTVSRHETRVGTLLGTLEYMSPEQASGKAVDYRSDQFSSGLVLWEMAAGRPTFRRDTPAQVLAAVIEREAPPLRELRPEVPADLESLVVRCLQKDPARRFTTTDELASEVAMLAGRSRSGSLSGPLAPRPSAPPSVPGGLLPPLPDMPGLPSLGRGGPYYIQRGDNDVKVYEEAKLVKALRRGNLSGLEMVRREGEEQWQPLYQSRIYRLEVPSSGDPRDAARWRLMRGLGGHFTGFFITAAIMVATTHGFPSWLWIWGVVLAAQALRTAPAAWQLYQRSQKPLEAGPEAAPAAKAMAAPLSAMAQEAERVRALIAQRGGKNAEPLIAEVAGIVKRTEELVVRMADLEEQTSPSERASVTVAVSEARARIDAADSDQDRRLFERQLSVLVGRQEAIGKAVRVLERLRVRRDLAEHQLKQLRLDLSRGAAGDLALPELSSRLEFIRDEIDAREEVDEIAKGGK
jgi:serine/threonine protein kinase